jgi:hypothetical protein
MLLVYPDGPAPHATNSELNIAFDLSPNYSEITRAASDGLIYAARIRTDKELQSSLRPASESVRTGVSVVLDVVV